MVPSLFTGICITGGHVAMSSTVKPRLSAEDRGAIRRGNTTASLTDDDDAFRQDTNRVLRQVSARMQREDHHFYPRIYPRIAAA
ncbi:hypothetical protein BM451_15010 [Dickeya dadantii]|uniref:hypothetical protein n=1 Tax=Dickeya dadantii TaxID=204038 RepID=UPI0009CB478B|nr:hypothetical protein [Dickeya dadantii]OOC12682.1 hypothetical protein BM451_15010 [Dickeya dadantii]UAY98229.1 hypothetical protein KTF62_10445 [Dickeya dadantii]